MTLKKTLLILGSVFITVSCSSKSRQTALAVFVPGILSDSPSYAMLAAGAKTAVDDYNTGKSPDETAKLTVVEAGTNQAEWSSKITALAATGSYEVIISSNPSMPEIVTPIVSQFPNQKFILLDAYEQGNPNIATVRYNQREQAYLTGYISGLMSKTHKIGLIAAQQYPIMDTVILPGYREGADAAYPGTVSDYRIVGNWYDASKGAELARAMADAGTDIILPVCGGASQGVISAATEKGFYITWFDDNGFSKAPGHIISSTVMEQNKMAREITSKFLSGTISWGTAATVGVRDGYITFVQDDPQYLATVPADIRSRMAQVVSEIKDGTLALPQ